MQEQGMKVSLEGNELVIRLKVNQPLEESNSGKTLVVASSYGNQETDLVIEGKKVRVGVNAYVPKKSRGK